MPASLKSNTPSTFPSGPRAGDHSRSALNRQLDTAAGRTAPADAESGRDASIGLPYIREDDRILEPGQGGAGHYAADGAASVARRRAYLAGGAPAAREGVRPLAALDARARDAPGQLHLAAVALWRKNDLEHFLATDYTSDLSEATKLRLWCIDDKLFNHGESVFDQWTFYPNNVTRTSTSPTARAPWPRSWCRLWIRPSSPTPWPPGPLLRPHFRTDPRRRQLPTARPVARPNAAGRQKTPRAKSTTPWASGCRCGSPRCTTTRSTFFWRRGSWRRWVSRASNARTTAKWRSRWWTVEEAIRAGLPFELILMDVNMPVIDGLTP